MTPAQLRAARAAVRISVAQLATLANLAPSTVKDFEGGRHVPVRNNIRALREVLEYLGVRFTVDGIELPNERRSQPF